MAAPTRQQYAKHYVQAEATTIDVSFGATPLVDALIVVFAQACDQSVTTDPGSISISDNQGNTYTSRVTQQVINGLRGGCWTAPATTSSGTFTVTATCGTASSWSIIVLEVRGYDGTTIVEKSGSTFATVDGGHSPYSPLNFSSTTNAEQLFLGCTATLYGYSRNYNADGASGWSLVDRYNGVTDRTLFCCIEQAVTSTGTYDPTWTTDGGGVGCVTRAISIIAGNAGIGGGETGTPKSTKFFLMGIG